MKNFVVGALLFIFFLGCSQNDDESVNVHIESFLINQNCFSTYKLQQAEVVITSEEDFKLFEDSIRVFRFASCDTIYLPKIDFDSSFFIGVYTQTSGCSVTYEYQVQFFSENSLYEYLVKCTSIGTCEKLNAAFNCAIVPRLSNQISVNMNTEYQ